MLLVRAQGAVGGTSLRGLSRHLKDQRGAASRLGVGSRAQEKSQWEPRESGPTGSAGGRSWLCALRVCSVLHNQRKLLKWGEPEGEGDGEGNVAPPP